MPQTRYVQLIDQADAVRDVLRGALTSIDQAQFMSAAVRALKQSLGNAYVCRYQSERHAELVSADGLYILILRIIPRRQRRWAVTIDVMFQNNPKGAGRKSERWPEGMGGRGNVASLQVPQVILADVKAVAHILAWNSNPEGRWQALRDWLSER